MLEAKPILLEPIMELTIIIPEEYIGILWEILIKAWTCFRNGSSKGWHIQFNIISGKH